jgi:hypothetical protein
VDICRGRVNYQDHGDWSGERVRRRHLAGRRQVRAGDVDHEQPEHRPAHVRGQPGRGPADHRREAGRGERVGYDDWATTIENADPSDSRKVINVQQLLGLPDSTPNPQLR